ncbi:hypothetical protein LSAT2_009062, partial [Lamellibrachia satsuma]
QTLPTTPESMEGINHLAQGDGRFVSGSDAEAGVLREGHLRLVVYDEADTCGVRQTGTVRPVQCTSPD